MKLASFDEVKVYFRQTYKDTYIYSDKLSKTFPKILCRLSKNLQYQFPKTSSFFYGGEVGGVKIVVLNGWMVVVGGCCGLPIYLPTLRRRCRFCLPNLAFVLSGTKHVSTS